MDPYRWQEIQSTFDTIVEMDDVERGNRLTALSDSDPELRVAVELLLAADSEVEGRLTELEEVFFPSAPSLDPLGLTGRTISHFEIREPIGAGGMGVVYRAEDVNLGRAVALKFLLPSYSPDASAKARFLREARWVAALDHPNLCAIHEVGTSDDGRPFLAMALYPGETLKARLTRDGPMVVSDALAIAKQVAEGLEYAHGAGIVHRDLKPGNVMLLPDGAVKILDFGLAKAQDQSLSESGARFGTVSYMAPEQIRGETADGRADLWALGVVLYEMLAARKPFGGEREIAIAHAILHDKPPPLTMHRADVSAAVEDLVLRLLEKDPARRPATASELVSQLAGIDTAAQGVVGSLRTRWRRARRTLSPRRKLIMTAFCAMVVFGGAVGYTMLTRENESYRIVAPRTAIAVLPFRNLNTEAFAHALHEEILTQLYTLPAVKVIGRTSVIGYSDPDTMSLRRIASELGVGSVVKGSVGFEEGLLRVNVQLIDVATDAELWAKQYKVAVTQVFSTQADIVQKIVAAVGAPVADSQRLRLTRPPTGPDVYFEYLAGREYMVGRNIGNSLTWDFAQLFLDRAIRHDSAFALARAARSELYGQRQRFTFPPYPEHGPLQRNDAATALRLAPDLPQAHFAMGMANLLGDRRDPAAALREFMIALKGFPRDADVWARIAESYRDLGNWNEAVVAYERAMELDPRNGGLPYSVGGPSFTYMRRYADAVRAFDRASTLSADSRARYVGALEKAKIYVLWRGQLDSLRSAVDRFARIDRPRIDSTISLEYARLLFWERRTDSLLVVLRRERTPLLANSMDQFLTTSVQNQFLPTSLLAAWTYQLRGDGPAARAAFDSALAFMDTLIHIRENLDMNGSLHAARGLALAGLGRRTEALRDAQWLQESAPLRNNAVVNPVLGESRAHIYAQVGDADRALDELERLLASPSLMSVHTLRLDPLWDPIRDHPRFRALLAKYRR